LGQLWTKVEVLSKGGSTSSTTQQTTAAAQPPAAAAPNQPASGVTVNTIKDLFKKDVVKFGDANKKVLFVEVGDPSCPYCHVAGGHDPEINKQMGGQFTLVADGGTYVAPVPEMKKLVDSGKAGFVYVYTPGHGNGEMGMKALYCANESGKFWQAHDLLMTNAGYNLMNTAVKNDKTKSGDVADFLTSVVNAPDMKKCLDSGKYDARLPKDIAVASSLGVSGTPGFFVNSTLFAGAYSFKDMETAVNNGLK
jgi:protein-disulfide isomerase